MIAPQALAKPRPSAPADQAPCRAALPGRRLQGQFGMLGGGPCSRRCCLPPALPIHKGRLCRATPPTWGWGQGPLRTQRHSESGTNAPVSAPAEAPEEALMASFLPCPGQLPRAHPRSPKRLLPPRPGAPLPAPGHSAGLL